MGGYWKTEFMGYLMPIFTKKPEESSGYYNKMVYHVPYPTDRFKMVYATVRSFLRDHPDPENPSILEVGCGTGVLGQQLKEQDGYRYWGFDFSQKALSQAPASLKPFLFRGSAYHRASYEHYFDVLVAVEVFEHLDDLRVLGLIPEGKRVVFSVPNFNSRSHLRYYMDEADIVGYYQDHLTINDIRRINTKNGKAIFVCDTIRLPS